MTYDANKANRLWRKNNPDQWNKIKKANYKQTRPKISIYRYWEDYEITLILNSKRTDRQLAKILKRSVQSIQIKRSRLN